MAAFFVKLLLLAQFPTATTQTATITGVLRSPDGSPAAGVRIAAMAARDSASPAAALVSLTETDGDGRYRLESVPAGRYFIIAGLVDFPTYYPGVTDLSKAEIVQVRMNDRLNAIDFTMLRRPFVKVSGRVLGALDGVPPAARVARLALEPVGISALFETALNPDGSFEFPRVIPGAYYVLTPINRLGSASPRIDVGDRDVAGIEIFPPVAFPGRLVVDGAAAPADFMVQAHDSRTGGVVATAVGSDATFRLALPAGEYRFSIGGSVRDYYSVNSIAFGSADISTRPLHVDSTVIPNEIVVKVIRTTDPIPGVSVSGRVRGASSVLRVSLFPKSRDARGSETGVKSDGSFVFLGVPPGSYEVVLYGAVGPTPAITVGNENVSGIELVMKEGASARGAKP